MEYKVKEIIIPDNVKVNYDPKTNTFTVEGPKGSISRSFEFSDFKFKLDSNKAIFEYSVSRARLKKNAHTIISVLESMIKGVTEGFTYKLKIYSTHFPMQVKVEKNKVSVVNFLGEKNPRVAIIDEDLMNKAKATIKLQGEEIIIEGIDKEIIGNIAGKIEQITRISDRDRRKFEDGIYIIEKAGKVI